jgi:hypothetical protein
MVMMRQGNGREPGDEPDTSEVDERALAVMGEFEGHFREVVALHPEMESRREHVFQAWTMQKIAGLQLVVERLARDFNAHLDIPEM